MIYTQSKFPNNYNPQRPHTETYTHAHNDQSTLESKHINQSIRTNHTTAQISSQTLFFNRHTQNQHKLPTELFKFPQHTKLFHHSTTQ